MMTGNLVSFPILKKVLITFPIEAVVYFVFIDNLSQIKKIIFLVLSFICVEILSNAFSVF